MSQIMKLTTHPDHESVTLWRVVLQRDERPFMAFGPFETEKQAREVADKEIAGRQPGYGPHRWSAIIQRADTTWDTVAGTEKGDADDHQSNPEDWS